MPTRLVMPLIAAFFLATATLGACTSGEDLPEVQTAFETLITALDARDLDALWEMSDPSSREELHTLVGALRETGPRLAEIWGGPRTPETVKARAALWLDLVEDLPTEMAAAGPLLLERVIDLERLRWTDGSREALKHPTIALDAKDPARAVVRVPSGESFVFVRRGDRWYSALIAETFLSSAEVRSLRGNLDKTIALLAEVDSRWRTTLDARTPQGAYNLLRQVIAAPANEAARQLYSMIDPRSRDILKEALERSRSQQRQIQARLPRAHRAKAYEDSGIAMLVEAGSDRELFERWYADNPLDGALSKDPPERFIEDGADGGRIVTKSGKTLGFSRTEAGFWALTELAAPLEATLNATSERPPE